MIPEEIARKYLSGTLDEYKEAFGDTVDNERRYYQWFLDRTDYEIIKSYETLMTEPTKFLTNLISMYKTNSEIIKWRIFSREKLNKIDKEA